MMYMVVGLRYPYNSPDEHKNFYACTTKEEAENIMGLLKERQNRLAAAKVYFDINFKKNGLLLDVRNIEKSLRKTAELFDLEIDELSFDEESWDFKIECVLSHGEKALLYTYIKL